MACKHLHLLLFANGSLSEILSVVAPVSFRSVSSDLFPATAAETFRWCPRGVGLFFSFRLKLLNVGVTGGSFRKHSVFHAFRVYWLARGHL
jgi:hypothetical protein